MIQNLELKTLMAQKNIKQWEVAEALGIAEGTFIRWLRYSLTTDRRNAIMKAINQVEEEKKGEQ